LTPAVAVTTLGVGLHGHGGEEVLHGVVAEIITDRSELQQKPGRQRYLTSLLKTTLPPFRFPTAYE